MPLAKFDPPRRAISTLLLALLPLGAAGAGTELYHLEKTHADLAFEINHLGFSNKHGSFRALAATLNFDPVHPESSSVEVTVNADSIDTGLALRDKELTGTKFLDAVRYPQIHFVSTRLTPLGEHEFTVEGNLTLHGVTRPISLKATLNKIGPNPFDKQPTVGFTASGRLNRSDYGITTILPAIADEVRISIDVEFNQK